MRFLSGILLQLIWVVSVSGPCPENCEVIQNPSLLTCNTDTGACFRGCKAGYHGRTCNMSCDTNCQLGTCQQRDGSCSCEPGYTFNAGSCDFQKGVSCESNDHCLNNTCRYPGRPDCLEGCKPGWFGKFCQQRCSPHCNCDEVTGDCNTCIPGWYGADCRSDCSPGCVNKNCHRNGTCVYGCITGTYGDQCDLKCSKLCVSGCDQLSGDCVQCEAGRYGQTCQFSCSAGCAGANSDCNRDGICTNGCLQDYFGEKCESKCSQQCVVDSCDMNGTCSTCNNGFFGTRCNGICPNCKDDVCNQMTGKCIKGCESGFYGSFCNLTCEDCTGGDCNRATGECRHKDDQGHQWSSVQSWVGGGVAVVILIIIAVYVSHRLKRIQGVVYDTVKWRRGPPSAEQNVQPVLAEGHFELEEQVTIPPERVCQFFPIRQTSYIESRHSGNFGNLQPQHQLQVAGVPHQQEDESQGAAAPPSVRLLQKFKRRSNEWNERPDSYVSPHYCEVNEEGMATTQQPAQGAQASTSVVKTNLFSVAADVHATRGDIRIPPIAECFGPIGTEDSSPDVQPLVENYDHLNRECIPRINGAPVSSYTQDDDKVRTNLASSGQISGARPDDYIEPQHSGNIVPSQQQMLSPGASDQQEDEPQTAVAPPSDRLLHDALTAKGPQPAEGAEAPAHEANSSSLSVIADVQTDRGDISISLIAECFEHTETEDSSPDDDSKPYVENYDPLFRDHYMED